MLVWEIHDQPFVEYQICREFLFWLGAAELQYLIMRSKSTVRYHQFQEVANSKIDEQLGPFVGGFYCWAVGDLPS